MDWPYDKLDTVDAGTFYLDVARAGIQYGPHFRMLERRHISGGAVVLRCVHGHASTVAGSGNPPWCLVASFVLQCMDARQQRPWGNEHAGRSACVSSCEVQ